MNVLQEQIGQWHQPVYVRVGYHPTITVHGPEEALVFLADALASSARYRFAREVCGAALTGHVSLETARDAFIIAAEDGDAASCAPGSDTCI